MKIQIGASVQRLSLQWLGPTRKWNGYSLPLQEAANEKQSHETAVVSMCQWQELEQWRERRNIRKEYGIVPRETQEKRLVNIRERLAKKKRIEDFLSAEEATNEYSSDVSDQEERESSENYNSDA